MYHLDVLCLKSIKFTFSKKKSLCGVVGMILSRILSLSVIFFHVKLLRSKQSDSLTPFYQLVYQVVVILEPLWVDGSSSSCAHIEGEETNYYSERSQTS